MKSRICYCCGGPLDHHKLICQGCLDGREMPGEPDKIIVATGKVHDLGAIKGARGRSET